jgi:hypothetical protein
MARKQDPESLVGKEDVNLTYIWNPQYTSDLDTLVALEVEVS